MVYKFTSLKEYREELSDGLAIVLFSAVWCAPCQVIGPHFELFSRRYKTLTFYKVDIDELDEIANAVGVSAIPSFYVYCDGELLDHLVGASSVLLEKFIKKYYEYYEE